LSGTARLAVSGAPFLRHEPERPARRFCAKNAVKRLRNSSKFVENAGSETFVLLRKGRQSGAGAGKSLCWRAFSEIGRLP
jgi:CelD/BcsL family acetyltransferase involved in cellulose biosynthesis